MSLPRQLYAVAGHACDAIGCSLTLACPYDALHQGIQLLRTGREMQLRLDYQRLGWQGGVRRRSTNVPLPAHALLAPIEGCRLQVTGLSWSPGYARLPRHELDNLTRWPLLQEDFELVTVPNGSSFRLGIRRGSAAVEAAWRVVAGGTEATLQEIREREEAMPAEARRRRHEAAAFLLWDGAHRSAEAGPGTSPAAVEPREEEAVL